MSKFIYSIFTFVVMATTALFVWRSLQRNIRKLYEAGSSLFALEM